jgi:single-strand DNA-binding protein
MFNEAQLNASGYVASEPVFSRVGTGSIAKLTMKVAWTTRRRDPSTGEWVDGNTSFVRVTCWRRLAENLATCLRKGEPIVLRGRIDVRPFTGKDGVRRVSVDVDASHVGYDLSRGVASFKRVWETTGKTAEEAAAENGGYPAGGDSAEEAAAENGGYPAGGDSADGEPVLAAVPDGGPVPGAADGHAGGAADGQAGAVTGDGAGEEIFDDSAIEALARDSGSVATPF